MRFFFLIVCFLTVNISALSTIKPHATIKRIVETREGRKSCWGVVINLMDLSFNKSVTSNELSIIEGKHSRSIKGIMTWYVDETGKKLIIKFKRGSGNFGSGNWVNVRIKSSALIGSLKENIKLSISTDI